MLYYRQITGQEVGVEGVWFVELGPDGVPIDEFVLIPISTMPGVVPVRPLRLGEDLAPHTGFTQGEWASIAILMMQRRMAERQEMDAGS